MSNITEQNHIEEEYFTAISQYLVSVIGLDEDKVEENTHRIMDAWTFDGKLDTDSLDHIMAAWPTEDEIRENDYDDNNWTTHYDTN